VNEYEQHPSEALTYTADFSAHCARRRRPDTDVSLNTIVRSQRVPGWQYRATTAGHTGGKEPRWPIVELGTVIDGSVEWTAEQVTQQSLQRTLSTVSWSTTSGLTIGAASTSATESTVLISGGVDGQDYEVLCAATCSDGTLPVIAFTVKVRKPARVVAA
jgi:hypothetical protein